MKKTKTLKKTLVFGFMWWCFHIEFKTMTMLIKKTIKKMS